MNMSSFRMFLKYTSTSRDQLFPDDTRDYFKPNRDLLFRGREKYNFLLYD